MIDYEDLIPRLATFRTEIAKAFAESDLELLTVRHFLVKNNLTTEEEFATVRAEIRAKRFARLEKENLIRIQVVHENR
jgi:hypothetical protein